MHTTRRTFLGGLAAVGGLAALPAVRAQGTDLGAWLEGVEDADEVVDRTGQSTVTVEVGADDGFAFAPPVMRVDPGTTVVWEWTGEGGTHNVVADDGAFESEYHSDAGATFEYTPGSEGVLPYYCAPHKAAGMRGAVVGDVEVTLGGGGGTPAGEGTATPAGTPEETPDTPAADTFGGWLANTDNYDGIVHRTGEDVVRISVGAAGNGGALAFDPPAVHVDSGATVVWEWMTDGVSHDVVATDGSFASEPSARIGHRFGVTLDGDGVVKYECAAHSDAGMRGVIVVGRGEQEGLGLTGLAVLGGGIAALAASFRGGLSLHTRTSTSGDRE